VSRDSCPHPFFLTGLASRASRPPRSPHAPPAAKPASRTSRPPSLPPAPAGPPCLFELLAGRIERERGRTEAGMAGDGGDWEEDGQRTHLRRRHEVSALPPTRVVACCAKGLKGWFPHDSEVSGSENRKRPRCSTKIYLEFRSLSRRELCGHPNRRIEPDRFPIPNSMPQFQHPNRAIVVFWRLVFHKPCKNREC
jgi:hypothetical protein